MPEILRFEPNVPVEVSVQGGGGITVAGRYGDRVMYTLSDNRRMYVAPFVAQRIRELEIAPGEAFQICKREVKNGPRKTINWLVDRIEPETQLERELRESVDIANARNNGVPDSGSSALPEMSTGISPDPHFAEQPDSGPNGSPMHVINGPGNHPGNSEAPTSPPSAPETQLAHALKTAIAAAVTAENFAKTLDYSIRFTTEDIRSMGITVLIGMQQRTPR
jgi:hypothetical protein